MSYVPFAEVVTPPLISLCPSGLNVKPISGVDSETGKRGLYGLISGVNTDNGNRVTAIYRQEGDQVILTVIAVDLTTPAANDD